MGTAFQGRVADYVWRFVWDGDPHTVSMVTFTTPDSRQAGGCAEIVPDLR